MKKNILLYNKINLCYIKYRYAIYVLALKPQIYRCRTIYNSYCILSLRGYIFILLRIKIVGEFVMWNNYFFNIQMKYSMRVSRSEPLIIKLDAKNVTKNKAIDLLDRKNENSFINVLEKTAKYFTEKYNCYAILGSDEISFICEKPIVIESDLEPDEFYQSNEIISLFVQYFFDYFNEFDKHKKVYWHGKCFSIPKGKIRSFVKYRSKIIQNVMTTYFLIKKQEYNGTEKLDIRISKCKNFADYDIFKELERGILYYNGTRIDLDKFLDSGKIEETNKINVEDLFSNLTNL